MEHLPQRPNVNGVTLREQDLFQKPCYYFKFKVFFSESLHLFKQVQWFSVGQMAVKLQAAKTLIAQRCSLQYRVFFSSSSFFREFNFKFLSRNKPSSSLNLASRNTNVLWHQHYKFFKSFNNSKISKAKIQIPNYFYYQIFF